MANCKNFFFRLFFTLIIVGIALKQIQESYSLTKTCQDNIQKLKHFLYSIKITDLGYLYQISPRIILIMNISLILSALMFLFKIDGYMLFLNNFIIIQFLFVNNIFLDNSSKCYLIASCYLSIYGAFYYFKKNV